MDLKQSLRLSTQLLMTPQLQQAIKLLQLSRLELEQFVETQLAENPVLEEGTMESSDEMAQSEKEREHTETDVISNDLEKASQIVEKVSGQEGEPTQDQDFNNSSQEEVGVFERIRTRNSTDEEQPNFENMATKAQTLNDYLLGQVGELDFSEEEKSIAIIIIGNIDEKGYLSGSLEDIFQNEKFDLERVEGVLDTIQRLEPVGIGARTLQECLKNQLRALGLRGSLAERIVVEQMQELESRNFQAIAKALKVAIPDVAQAVELIEGLEPVPGRQFGNDNTQYIVPDVYVFKLGGQWVVSMNEDGLPKLKVSDFYKDMLKSTNASGDKDYLQDKIKAAQWLIKSIHQRQSTIYKVTEKIVEKQQDFFEKGVSFLKPMVLRDIADAIGMHESTVSRVTSNKYVHTTRGIFELKYFFNTAISTVDGENVASESVKRMINDLVKGEDPQKPLSDQQIAELLEEKGIQLARRTVAKYREQLNILPSSRRKRFFK